MMNLASMAIAVVALVQAWRPVLPIAGWSAWMIIPLALMGVGLGALSERSTGRDLNILVLVVASILSLLRHNSY